MGYRALFEGLESKGFLMSRRDERKLWPDITISVSGGGWSRGRGARSKSRLGKQGGMECVSTPLYVWSRDKKPGLPNFPPLESRATLRGCRRRRRRCSRRSRRRPHCGSLRLHRNRFSLCFWASRDRPKESR